MLCFTPTLPTLQFGVLIFFSLISRDRYMLRIVNCLLLLTVPLWKVFTPTLQPSFLLVLSAGTWGEAGAPGTRPLTYPGCGAGWRAGRQMPLVAQSAGQEVGPGETRGWEEERAELIRDRLPPPLAQLPSLYFCLISVAAPQKWLLSLGMVPLGLTLFITLPRT